MYDDLNVVLVQHDIIWHDVTANFSVVEKLLQKLESPVDLMALPETFCTGFTNAPEKIGNINLQLSQWMHKLAARYNAVIAGSFPYYAKNSYYNRLLAVHPNGTSEFYDKHHLFALSGEDKHYRAGNERKLFTVKSWKIFPLVCYDIRFPVWCRNDMKYTVLLVAANWPAARNETWETLLRARAIENQAYVLGVNRIGSDAQKTDYCGNSLVISPEGKILTMPSLNEEGLIQFSLSAEHLIKIRKKYPFLQDMDKFEFQ